ncbi:MAG TPA: septal ring lytic transglycosylase RlpA family protein [Nostocaceae cyanobacterium]|nr:septal ring lytic transglycosylase RlpA family protein [Nostocaceae cyanobacterium]
MILIGLLWITSWLGGFLPLYGILPPSWTAKVDPTKATANLDELVSHENQFFGLSNQQVNLWQTNLLPVIHWKIDWVSKVAKANIPKLSNLYVARAGETEPEFCSFVPENKVAHQEYKNANYLMFVNLEQPKLQGLDYSPLKILRSLKSFFHTVNSQSVQSSNSPNSKVLLIYRNAYNYEVWVNQRLIANIPDQATANLFHQRLTQLIDSPNLNPQKLRPAVVDGIPSLMVGNRFLFSIDQQIADQLERSSDILAIEWVNNLRVALQAPPLTLQEAQMQMYGLQPSETKLSGFASWYGDYFHGRLTANGEIYNQNELTVAHRSLPFNTYLQVTNLQNGKSVVVRVNDRGPYISPRTLDLSREAARCIDSEHTGVVPYEAVILKPTAPKMTLKPDNLVREQPRGVVLVSSFN